MKTLKSILAILLLISLISCKKKEIKPYIPTGEVTYSLTNNDTNEVSLKHISYGYENVQKDTIVSGNFSFTLKVPASDSKDDLKRIFIKCISDSPSNITLKMSQTLEFADNMPLFSITSSGTCSTKERSISNYFFINAE